MAVSVAASSLHEIERSSGKPSEVTWRLMPLLMLGYFCAYLDRSNVGMAATTMVKYLDFPTRYSVSVPVCSSWAISWPKFRAT